MTPAAVCPPLLREGAELGERALGHRLEPACSGGEDDAECAPVVGVAFATHQAVALEEAHHRRHRLLLNRERRASSPMRRPSCSRSGTSSVP